MDNRIIHEKGQSLMTVEEKTVFLFGAATQRGLCPQGPSSYNELMSSEDGKGVANAMVFRSLLQWVEEESHATYSRAGSGSRAQMYRECYTCCIPSSMLVNSPYSVWKRKGAKATI